MTASVYGYLKHNKLYNHFSHMNFEFMKNPVPQNKKSILKKKNMSYQKMNSGIALYTKFHYMTQIIMALYVDKLCNFYLQDPNIIMKPGNRKIR